MTTLTLTADQQAGYDAISSFVLDPSQSVFVLRGFSGTGKSTLVSHFLDQLPSLMKAVRLINPNQKTEYEVKLTATTNKAAEALAHATGETVSTIHSALSLRVRTDYKTGKTALRIAPGAEPLENTILVVDEASYIDTPLLHLIFAQTRRCKLLLMGDPDQLLNMNCDQSPVFNAGYPEVRLSQVVRQDAGNPIIDLSAQFRHLVQTGNWFSFVPDGHHIQHLSREDFETEIIREFTRSDRHHSNSRVLAWTNKTAIAYNKAIAQLASGSKELQAGDYAICNSYISSRQGSIKTDQMVHITKVSQRETSWYDTPGHRYELDGRVQFFMPESQATRKIALKRAQAEDNWSAMQEIQDGWLDLREAYASTINKSQGSTYDRVYIDLDDLKKCRNTNTLARLLYVGVSRARHQVFLTGDLV